MSRIDERLEIMGVDTSEMTTEEKLSDIYEGKFEK